MANFVNHLSAGVIRKSPLGPSTMNQLHANISDCLDPLTLREHFDDGQHNALEVPWILGAITSGTTGYLFDTGYGGGTIARPATGRVTLNAVSGVVGTIDTPNATAAPAACVIANVSDAAIATYPHVVEAEMVSATSVELRTRYMISTLGSAGNSWAAVAVGVDVAVHAQKQPNDVSLLGSHLTKVRRDFLTEQATDWNALAVNQARVRKAMMLEHASAGTHLVNRIAKASALVVPIAGPSVDDIVSEGVSSVTRVSAGIVQVNISTTLSATTTAACFCQAQPRNENELVIVNGRCTSTTQFTFYIYLYSVAEDKWTRDDIPFYAVMYGTPA